MDIKCQKNSKHMKLLSIMEPLSPILENGLEKDELMLKKHLEDIIFTLFQMKKILSQNQTLQSGTHTSCTPEFLQENNEMIWDDNLDSLNLNSQNTPLLKILDQESITNVMDSEPFWNNYSKEMSKKLWLPILIDSPDSDTISLNGCSHNSEQYWNQWKSQIPIQEMNSLMTSWKFSPSLQPVIMEKENTIISRKIKIHPTKKQKLLFQKCSSTHRFFYNKAISKINELYSNRKKEFEESKTCVHCSEPKFENSFCCQKHQKKSLPWKLNISLISLRKLILKSDKEIKGTDEEWQSTVPYDTRQLAIKDAVSAYKSAVQNKINGNIQFFQLKYKSRRSPSKLFWIDSDAIKISKSTIKIFPTRLGKKDCSIRIRKRQKAKLPNSIDQDCKIMTYGKDYYLVYTLDKPFSKIEKSREHIVSLDPGVRTFQTGYSPSGIAFKVGENQRHLLKKLHNRLDMLRSQRDKTKSKEKYQLRKKCLQIESKIKNVVSNLHNQLGSFLTENYESILLPEFGTSVMQAGKELKSTTKRNMWTLSHYKFQQKLKGLCIRTGTTLYIVKEHYTTKTCGECGTINNVGGSEIYKCNCCSYTMDRDIHGARNILLKHITQYGI
jgi:putative transposase